MNEKQLNILLIFGVILSSLFTLSQSVFSDSNYFGYSLFIALLYFTIRRDISKFVIISIITIPFAASIKFGSITFSPIFIILLTLNYLLSFKVTFINILFLVFAFVSIFISLFFYSYNFFHVFAGFSGLFGPMMAILIGHNSKIRLPNNIVFIPLIFVPVFIFELIYKPEWGGGYMSGVFRLYGICGQPNVFAAYLYPFSFVALSMFLEERKFKYLITSLIYLIFTILTFSRGGFISILIGLLLLIITINYSFKFNKKSILLLFIISITLIFSQDIIRGTRFENIGEQQLEDQRGIIWSNVLFKLNGKYWTGVGVGGYETKIQNNVKHYHTTHSIYLNYLANLGFIGLFFALYFYISFLLKVIRNFDINQKNKVELSIFRGGIISFVVLLIHGFINSGTLSPGNALYTLVLIGQLSSPFSKRLKNQYSK